MPSQAKIDANRQNARKSTGPRTAAGKAASRLNALKHGLTAETLLIRNEDKQQLTKLTTLMLDDLAPVGMIETLLAQRIVAVTWRLIRAAEAETSWLDNDLHEQFDHRKLSLAYSGPEVTSKLTLENTASTRLAVRRLLTSEFGLRLERYENAMERALYKALHELQRLQAARRGADVAAPIAVDATVGVTVNAAPGLGSARSADLDLLADPIPACIPAAPVTDGSAALPEPADPLASGNEVAPTPTRADVDATRDPTPSGLAGLPVLDDAEWDRLLGVALKAEPEEADASEALDANGSLETSALIRKVQRRAGALIAKKLTS